MANNRMILMCGVCRPFGSKAPLYGKPTKSGSFRRNKGVFILAKWYPSMGWGNSGKNRAENADLAKRLDNWLNKHRHECESSDEYRFRLEYESNSGRAIIRGANRES